MTRTVAVGVDSVDYIENGRLIARLTNTYKFSARTLSNYENDWRKRGQWPLAATHFPNN